MREIRCEVCGKSFLAQRPTRRKYCGNACNQKAKRKDRRERELGISRDPEVVKLCEECGEPTGDPAYVKVIPRGLCCGTQDCDDEGLPRDELQLRERDTIAAGYVPCARCKGPVPGAVPEWREPRRRYCNPECRRLARNRRRQARRYGVAKSAQKPAAGSRSGPQVVQVALPCPPSQEAVQRLWELARRRPGRNRVIVSWPAPADPYRSEFDNEPASSIVIDRTWLTAKDDWLIKDALSDVSVR